MRLIVVIGLALSAIGVTLGVFSPLWAARTMVEDFKHLDQSADTTSAFKGFRQKHRAQLVDEQCRDNVCESQFLVGNWFLSKLHLAPRTELRAWMMMDQQKAGFFALEYTSFIFKRDTPVVHVQEDFCRDRTDISCDHFALNPHGRNVSPDWNGDIEFGQLATKKQKDAASSINLTCLVALHGCGDITVLQPNIWVKTGRGVVSSCLRSTSDSLVEATQPLSGDCGVK